MTMVAINTKNTFILLLIIFQHVRVCDIETLLGHILCPTGKILMEQNKALYLHSQDKSTYLLKGKIRNGNRERLCIFGLKIIFKVKAQPLLIFEKKN